MNSRPIERVSPGDQARFDRLCELMNAYARNMTDAERDQRVQAFIAQGMTERQRIDATVALMNFSMACSRRRWEAERAELPGDAGQDVSHVE